MEQRPTPIEPDSFLEGLHWSAILLGAIVDNLLTLLGTAVLMIAFGGDLAAQDEAAAREAMEQAMSAPAFLLGGLTLGAGATVFGAFVGARRAGSLYLRHGGWVAVCSAVLSLVFFLAPEAQSGSHPPLWYEMLGWLLLIPSGLLGGAIAERLG